MTTWLPYAASYVTLFVSHLGRTFLGAIKGSILNVLPAALLGVGVVVSDCLMASSKSPLLLIPKLCLSSKSGAGPGGKV